jgi:signal transduction histidine kinase
MKQSPTLRFISLACAIGGFGLWLALVYFVMTMPSLPYQGSNPRRVDSLSDPARAGALQPGDKLLAFNNQRLERCTYLTSSPLYSASRNAPIPVSYERPGRPTPLTTHIVLTNLSLQEMLSWSPGYLAAFVFVVAGLIILVGGRGELSHLLLGLTWLSFGLNNTAWVSYLQIPLPIIAFWGTPLVVIFLISAHAIWPVNQLGRPVVRLMLGVVGLIALVHAVSYVPGSTWFGCHLSEAMGAALYSITEWTYSGLVVGYLGTLYLIFSAYRQTDSPFTRLQIRAIVWAWVLGFSGGAIYAVLYLPWGPLGDVLQFITGIVPLTYLFVLYRGELLAIDRYLNRLIFTCLFVIFWIVVTVALAKGILFWQPGLDPVMVAVLVALASLLAATLVRERMGMLVDLVLYGAHYEYETVVSHLGQNLAGAQSETQFASVVVQQLPQALSIREAALWLAEPDADAQLRRVDRSPGMALPLSAFPPGNVEVEVFNQPLNVGSDPTPWLAMLRLYADTRLVGIVLLGLKYRESTYSQRDVHTLKTLTGWMATTAANLAHRAEQERATERERRLMLALAENEERLTTGVAHELHDRGISALGIVRLMVEQERSRAIISAGLEQVIANLRELSDHQLSPQGLNRGLPQALEAMVETQRQLGLPVSLEIAASYTDGEPLSPFVSRELFYIAQEAVVNALKHATPSRVEISLTRPNSRQVQLRIWNNGRAFDVAPNLIGREAHGMGIMQARANRIGGQLTIHSHPDSGTEVTVHLDPAGL